jgi:hypothetical protein
MGVTVMSTITVRCEVMADRTHLVTATTLQINKVAEVGNVTSKCNGVTRCCLCHVLRAITFRSDNDSNFDTAVTLGCDNGSKID